MEQKPVIINSLDETWRLRASCKGVGLEVFFVEKGASTKIAKKICQYCIVRSDCLNFALDNNETYGIWGGCGERERRRLKRARASTRQEYEVSA
jgi:WhiB family redox-sensing transcriptional regulator